MKKALTLVEILIVVAVLGILAAVALPTFQSHTQLAKEAAAKDSLRILRNAIELYAARHNGIAPGYPFDDTSYPVNLNAFIYAMCYQNYLNALPENPFNHITFPRMIADDEPFPTEPTGEHGWVYQPQTKTIKLDWPGTDSKGVRYYDY